MPPEKGGPRRQYTVTEPGRARIRELYNGTSANIDILSAELIAPRYMIKKWAREEGLTRTRNDRRWTTEEEDYLELHLRKVSLKKIGAKLGRTPAAVKQHAYRLGISKCLTHGYTLSKLSVAVGYTRTKVERWVNNGWLKGVRRQTERTEGQSDVWYFSNKEVRKFIKEHPLEIDGRRVDMVWLVDLLTGDFD